MGGVCWSDPIPPPFISLVIPVCRSHQFLYQILSLHLKTPHWPLRISNLPLGSEYEYLTCLKQHNTNWLLFKVLFEIYPYFLKMLFYLVPSKPT